MSHIRIISGIRKGRRIKAPNTWNIRPTTDFAKEALFNILSNHFDFAQCNVLDLFAGTGNISYEFASRGALLIFSIDINHHCIKFINETSKKLNFQQINAIQTDALSFLEKNSNIWDIIFCDPPFDYIYLTKIPRIIFERKLLAETGMLIIEHSTNANFSNHDYFIETRKYGSVLFSFFDYIHIKNNFK